MFILPGWDRRSLYPSYFLFTLRCFYCSDILSLLVFILPFVFMLLNLLFKSFVGFLFTSTSGITMQQSESVADGTW